MATLTPIEYGYAIGLDWEKLPNRLRCAVCNKAVVDAMKTDCCDTTICGPCSEKLSGTCPVCEHKISPDMTREDKRTRTTLKAHIKGELQKRNNAAAAAAAKEATAPGSESQVAVSIEGAVSQPPVSAELVSEAPAHAVSEEPEPPQDYERGTSVEHEQEGPAEDAADDKSDIDIITEDLNDGVQRGFVKSTDMDMDKQQSENAQHAELQQEEDQQEEEENSMQEHTQGFDDSQQNFMNFAAMQGFNPMMAMQSMGMPPFGMMPNMMGMPNMGMDPSMMFNGGFAGMNGMASMMNGNMMNGNFGNMSGMGDMNDFSPYNHQYGNRYDNRGHGNQFSNSNRGYGRGYGHNQNFRGRGQGFYRGRGRGWQQHQHHNNYNQQYGQQQEYPTENGDLNAVDSNQDYQSDYHSNAVHHDGEKSYDDGNVNGSHDAVAQHIEAQPHTEDAPETDTDLNRNSTVDKHESEDLGHNAHDPTITDWPSNGDHPTDDQYSKHDDSTNQTYQSTSVVVPAAPINAPTGPRAMREGLPNSGRFSRPQGITAPRPPSREQGPPVKAPTGPAADRHRTARREESHIHNEQNDRARRDSMSRSRSPARHDHKSRRHRSRTPKRDYDEERSNRDDRDERKRKDQKRAREYEDDHRDKKRSRSASPDGDSLRRRHRHRDEKDRSRRDRSREKHRSNRDRDHDDEHERRKSKSHKSSKRDRVDNYAEDETAQKSYRQARPALEEPQDDIGFKIKGIKSGTTTASARDPYAEERERSKNQRLQRDAERRQGSKRDRDDDDGEHTRRKKRSRPKPRYEDEIELDHDQNRDGQRWR